MDKLILLLLLFSYLCQPVYSQSCLPEEQVQKQLQKDVLDGFIFRSLQANFLTKEKGVVRLEKSVDSLGREVWELAPFMYDFYRETPRKPQSYYNFNGWIVFIWDERTDGQALVDSAGKEQLLRCLDKLAGNRITHKPPFDEHWEWTTRGEFYGLPRRDPRYEEKILIRGRTFSTGTKGKYGYIFERNGTTTRYIPLG